MSANTLNKVNRLTAAAIQGMSDAELEALAVNALKRYDLSSLSDADLNAIVSGHANKTILRRVTLLETPITETTK